MTPEQIKTLIQQATSAEQVILSGEGCSLDAIVVSPAFEGKTPIQRQRMVYAAVDELLRSGELHALALKTFTPEQWVLQGRN